MKISLLLLSPALSLAALAPAWASRDCELEPGALNRAFPNEFSVCWSNPAQQLADIETLAMLKKPETYDFARYGNPIAGVLLSIERGATGLLLSRGRLYARLNPIYSARTTRDALERLLSAAGQVWLRHASYIEWTAAREGWWLVEKGPRGQYLFTPLGGAAAPPGAGVGYLEKRQEMIGYFVSHVPGAAVSGRVIDLADINLDDLDEREERVYWALEDMFAKEAEADLREQIKGRSVPRNTLFAFCYSRFTGVYQMTGYGQADQNLLNCEHQLNYDGTSLEPPSPPSPAGD